MAPLSYLIPMAYIDNLSQHISLMHPEQPQNPSQPSTPGPYYHQISFHMWGTYVPFPS